MKRRYLKPPPSQVLGGDPFIKPKVQTKLTMGKSEDKYEVEADSMADQVINNTKNGDAVQKMGATEEEVQQKPLAASISPVKLDTMKKEEEPVQAMEEEEPIQAKEEEEPVQAMEEEEPVQTMEEEEPVQRQENEQMSPEDEEAIREMKEAGEIPIQPKLGEDQLQTKSNKPSGSGPSLESRLKQSKGGGIKMDAKTRQQMESRFGTHFGNIRIHTDANAIQMSKELGAQAFTHGNDIYFNKGKYNPNSKEGQHLLAHELTHTIQQKGGKIKSKDQEGEVPME
ncbi:DUF4157 domain-containing protein [Mariniflexile sp. AS56]|uniref:eCIS core domain-containing protein n=1 Tax=Mariniflexile sp. AS56 TaxID=3063957 RepID=UPI0026F04175|nr:DUF4157 domain-containing protein [Mariniflexile sp. AS56]MDO7174056.1 DUF4157 domain-containing protein [Mariniflexile sp. AS56]